MESKQYSEVEECKNGFLGRHRFDAITKGNGVVVWECSLCGVTRGVCQHEIDSATFPVIDHVIGITDETYYLCSHCNQAMEAPTIGVEEPPEDAPDPCLKEYEAYLKGKILDPRD
jgi:hypothetical protein